MITTHGPGRDFHLKISPLVAKIITGLIVAMLIFVIYLVAVYGRVYYLALQCQRYQRLNEELRISMNNLNKLKQELQVSENFRRKLSNLLGLEKTPLPINIEVIGENKSEKGVKIENFARRDVPSILPVRGFISQSFTPEHPAIDIAAMQGTPVVASADGFVKEVGWDSVYGNYVTLEHGTYSTFYGHLFKADVTKNDRVVTGQVIGYVGSTGVSSSPHLHYGVKLNGRWVDPRTYFVR